MFTLASWSPNTERIPATLNQHQASLRSRRRACSLCSHPSSEAAQAPHTPWHEWHKWTFPNHDLPHDASGTALLKKRQFIKRLLSTALGPWIQMPPAQHEQTQRNIRICVFARAHMDWQPNPNIKKTLHSNTTTNTFANIRPRTKRDIKQLSTQS